MITQFKMKFIAGAALACACTLAVASQTTGSDATANAANGISEVRAIRDEQGTELRLVLSSALKAAPPVTLMSNPARLVFDVPQVANRTGKKDQGVREGGVHGVSLIQADGMTRVIVDIRDVDEHTLGIKGNELVLRLGSVHKKPPQVASAPQQQQSQSAKGPAPLDGVFNLKTISGVDFRRGPAGEGRVVVDLHDASVKANIKSSGNAISVEFSDVTVADKFIKRLNVSDFGTPIQSFTMTRTPKGAVLNVLPQGAWEYNAYQTESRFVMEVRNAQRDARASAQSASVGYKGERISLNFQNVEVRNLLNVIADFTKLNIVTTDSVQGSMSIRLQDIPWDQALDIILQSRGLDMRKSGSVIFVAPAEEIAKREKDRLEATAQNQSLEMLKTENFQLNYTRAEDVSKILSDKDQSLLSSRGRVISDIRTNQIFVQDTAEKLSEVAEIIRKIDIPVRQVMIEARIVEAGDNFSRSLGARLGFAQAGSVGLNGTSRSSMAASSYATGSMSGLIDGVKPDFLTQGQSVNLPAPALSTGAQTASLAMTLLNVAGTRFLNLELSALEADGRGKIVSSPSVVTADKEKAVIEQGTEIPYQEASASGATSVSFKKANLRLEVLPQITPDGNVIMAVEINKDAPGVNTSGGIAIDTKQVKTKVLVESGGTMVIGGIFTQEERNDVNKVPLLGDVPVLGNLFKNTIKKDNKTELLIFLTPRIIDSSSTMSSVR